MKVPFSSLRCACWWNGPGLMPGYKTVEPNSLFNKFVLCVNLAQILLTFLPSFYLSQIKSKLVHDGIFVMDSMSTGLLSSWDSTVNI